MVAGAPGAWLQGWGPSQWSRICHIGLTRWGDPRDTGTNRLEGTMLTIQSFSLRKRHFVVFLRVGAARARIGTWSYGLGCAVRGPRVRTWCAWYERAGRFHGRAG